MTNYIARGRQVVQPLTNQSGGGVIAGDVVIVSTANDESFTTTTSAAYNSTRVGVAQETIAAAATGRILLEGYAPLVNVSASATRGHYLLTHTVAKQATSQAGYASGAFGQILKAGTTPSAMIFPVAQVGSAGVARSGATTDGHVAVWNGSSADSIKDGGIPVASAIELAKAGSYTTSGTTFADIDTTNFKITLTTGAHRCLVGFTCVTVMNDITYRVMYDFAVDGTRVGSATLGLMATHSVTYTTVSGTYLTGVLTAASHTFSVQWMVSNASGVATIYTDSSNWRPRLWVMETLITA